MRRLFLLAVIAGAAVAVWTALQRRNEAAASTPAPSPSPSPAPPPPPPSTTSTTSTPSTPATTERWQAPVDGACPEEYPIKVAKSGIYHVPGGRSYERTTADRCYMNAEDAEADGYRRAKA